MRYFDLILPLPLRQTFTYHLEDDDANIDVGFRVVVNFGGRKFVTGIVKECDTPRPEDYATKPIEAILDNEPIACEKQISFWQWVADYYMCSIGEVMKAALPSGLKMENKSKAILNPHYEGLEKLKGNEAKVYNLLSHGKPIEIATLSKDIEVKNIAPILRRMVDKGIVEIEDNAKQKYQPKYKVFFALNEQIKDETKLDEAFEQIKRAKKQVSFLTKTVILSESSPLISKTDFLKEHDFSSSVYNELISKKIITEELKEVSRFDFLSKGDQPIQALSEEQDIAFNIAKKAFKKHQPVLLHGVTASGKTEVYIHLIKEQLDQGKQILFLLPEIAITVEMLQRLNAVFGDRISIFHSRYSDAQRVEVWRKINDNEEGHLVLGARSALFLPFKNLGLIVVDEEHEESFKQKEPAPHYHARDAAVMLAHRNNANIILGSATPSIETAYNGQLGKYAVAHLMTRYSQVAMPQITPVDMADAYKKNKRQHHFSFHLIEKIKETLENKEQVIIFQNRRGYSGFVECKECGHVPQCKNCDISLTYHQRGNMLKCHYCGHHEDYKPTCNKCNSKEVDNKGIGTERITEQAQEIFPTANIERFDQDTTRGKGTFERIIDRFKTRKTDILVGTQMIAKGLDFDNVGLVAIINADNMMNFPDFRAHEKAYQLMSQVAGRAGRREKQGQVILQSYTPDYELIKSVTSYDYSNYFAQQLAERKEFNYPPFAKLIGITIKHKDWRISHSAAYHLGNKLREKFGFDVLGPEEPSVNRIKLLYLQRIILKVGNKAQLQPTKNWIIALSETIKQHESYKAITISFDVDF